MALVRTALGMVCRPGRVFRAARVEGWRSVRRVALNSVLAGAAFVVPRQVASLWAPSGGLPSAAQVVEAVVVLVVTALIVSVLTAIEGVGLWHFGRRRRWRVRPGVSATVCAHASLGWVIGGLIAGLGYAEQLWWPSEVFIVRAFNGARLAEIDLAVLLWMGPGWLIGFALFEVWAYVGFSAMRFANVRS